MQVTFPSHHVWLKDISEAIDTNFSGRAAKKINASLPLLSDAGVTYSIKPLNAAFFVDFSPLYTQNIGSKRNSLLVDIQAKTLNNRESMFPYFCLSVSENDNFIGGTIFSFRTDRVSFAYRTFTNEWITAKLKASPALIGEYLIAGFASRHGKKFLSHGKDRNPYGLNTAIGLAGFKLFVGCSPSVGVVGTYEIRTLDTDKITEDCFVLELPKEGRAITKAYLVTSPENLEKYIQVTKYPDQLTVEVLFRK